jgi:hypothetical protein
MRGLSLGIYILWFVDVLFAFGTCWAIVKKGFRPHWKAFSYYLFFMAAQNLAFLPVYLFGNETVYEFTYYVGDFLEALLLSFVLLELLVKVLEPFEALPGRTVARFCFFTVLGVSTAVALSVVVPSHGHKLVVNFLTTVERTVFLAGAVILWVILFQAKALGISWKSAVAEISIAFVLYLTVGSARGFAMVLYNDHLAQDIAAAMGQLAYLIAMASWIWTMTHRDPVSRPSPEAIERIRQLASGTEIVPKERILAAVGIKVQQSEVDEATEEEDAGQPSSQSSKPKDSETPSNYLIH